MGAPQGGCTGQYARRSQDARCTVAGDCNQDIRGGDETMKISVISTNSKATTAMVIITSPSGEKFTRHLKLVHGGWFGAPLRDLKAGEIPSFIAYDVSDTSIVKARAGVAS